MTTPRQKSKSTRRFISPSLTLSAAALGSIPAAVAAFAAFTLTTTSVDAASLIYTLSGSRITGSLGATGFTDASWSMTMTADSANVISGIYGGGPFQFPYNYLAGSPVVTINTGTSTLTATIVPLNSGNTVGILSMGNPFTPTVFRNSVFERSAANTNPPSDSLGVMSSSLNSLTTEGSFGTNQYSNSSVRFNTNAGPFDINFFSNNSGSFTITAVPEPTSALLSALGASMLLRRRRRQAA